MSPTAQEGAGREATAMPQPPGTGRRLLWFALIVAVVSLAVYGNSLFNGFVYDDRAQILENRWLTSFRYLPEIFSSNVWGFSGKVTSYYRPLMHVIFLLTAQVFGLSPWGFHLVNIILHAANSLLVFLVILRITGKLVPEPPRATSLLAAFFGALVFAVHPVHTEVVAWVAGIPDLSFSLLYLLSFYLYIRAGEGGKWAFPLSVLCFFLATLCKEPALTLPVLLVAYDGTFDRRHSLSHYLRRYLPFAATAAVYFGMRLHALKGFAPAIPHDYLTPYQCLINILPIFGHYLALLVFPVRLSFIYVFHPISTIFGFEGIAGVIVTLLYAAAVWLAWQKNRGALIGLLLVVMPLLPAFYIRVIRYPFAERYLYLPVAGLALLVAIGATKAMTAGRPHWHLIAKALAALVVVLFSVGTVARNGVWKSDYTLWLDTVGKAPEESMVHAEMGHAFIGMGQVDQGIEEYRRAIALKENDAGLHNYLGTAYMGKGLVDSAIQEFQRALSLNSSDIDSRNNLGSAYLAKGMPDKAAEQLEMVLASRPDSVETLNNLGLAFKNMNQLDRAIGYYLAALRLRPDVAGLHYNLARVYELKGLHEQAAQEMRIAQQLQQQ